MQTLSPMDGRCSPGRCSSLIGEKISLTFRPLLLSHNSGRLPTVVGGVASLRSPKPCRRVLARRSPERERQPDLHGPDVADDLEVAVSGNFDGGTGPSLAIAASFAVPRKSLWLFPSLTTLSPPPRPWRIVISSSSKDPHSHLSPCPLPDVQASHLTTFPCMYAASPALVWLVNRYPQAIASNHPKYRLYIPTGTGYISHLQPRPYPGRVGKSVALDLPPPRRRLPSFLLPLSASVAKGTRGG